jgi:hypothetical protein
VAHDANGELPYKQLDQAPQLRTIGIAMTVIGAIALIAAFMTDTTRAFRSYYVNWVFFMSVAQGALVVSAAVSIAKGLWARPVRRLALSFAAFMPVVYLTMIPIFAGARHIWPWVSDPIPGKDVWLNVPFLTVRTMLGMGILLLLDLWFAYYALRPDIGLIRDRGPAALRPFYERMTRNWRGQEIEELHSFRKLSIYGPLLCVAYGLIMGMVGWDFIMSLEPHWFSTLIGPFFFMGGFLGGLMATAVLAAQYRKHLGLEQWITATTQHDLGKLCFGFTIFWGYLFFGQFIVIWYGLLPIEQSFVIHRFSAPFVWIAYIVGLCIFAIPFFGFLGVAAKKNPKTFTLFASTSLFGLWMERYLLTYPSFYLGHTNLPYNWQEPGLFIFFIGLFLLTHRWFFTRFPVFQMWVPQSEIELRGIPMERTQVANLR